MIKCNVMKKELIKSVLLFVFLFFAVFAKAQTAEERVYIQKLELVPGGEMQCMTIAIENASHDNYTAFQFDVELPAGLEVAYYDGEPEIYVAENNHVYPPRHKPAVMYSVDGNLAKIRCYSPTNKVFEKRSGALIDIYVVPTSYMKPGDVEIKLHDVKFSTVEETYGYKADCIVSTDVKASDECFLTLMVSSENQYATAIFPFDIETIPDELEVYSCKSVKEEYLMLEEQKSIVAYKPYILYAGNGFEARLSGVVDAGKYKKSVIDGYLTGTLVPQEITGGNGHYVMQKKDQSKAMFYKVGDTPFLIPAGKCWVTLPNGMQGISMLRMSYTTAIDELEAEKGNNVIYDLSGRQVNTPTKGLYIINGKKMLVK